MMPAPSDAHVGAAEERARRVLVLQHSVRDDLGSAAPWFEAHGTAVDVVHHWRGEPLPAPATVEALVVLGGGVGVYDAPRIDWLAAEIRLLEAVLARGRPVLGLCLGAQMLAAVHGARVFAMPERERGWWPVQPLDPEAGARLGLHGPTALFHWHGDQAELPRGARHLAASQACAPQAFALGERVLALQFHAEVTPHKAEDFVRRTHAQSPEGRWIEPAASILAAPADRYDASRAVMHAALRSVFAPDALA